MFVEVPLWLWIAILSILAISAAIILADGFTIARLKKTKGKTK